MRYGQVKDGGISKEEELELSRSRIPKRTKKETKELLDLIRKDTAKVRKQVKILTENN